MRTKVSHSILFWEDTFLEFGITWLSINKLLCKAHIFVVNGQDKASTNFELKQLFYFSIIMTSSDSKRQCIFHLISFRVKIMKQLILALVLDDKNKSIVTFES